MLTANRLCGQCGNIKHVEAKKKRHSPSLEEGKEEEELNGQEGGVGEGIGHLGIFVRNMKERLCWGACSALRIDCVLHVFTGDV